VKDFVVEVLRSDPAIVVYTLIGGCTLLVLAAVSPVGSWVREKLEDARDHNQIELLREFHVEMSATRKAEVSEVVKGALNGSLPRIERQIGEMEQTLVQTAMAQAARDAATEQRLAVGTEKMFALGEAQARNTAELAEIKKTVEGQTLKIAQVGTRVDTLLQMRKS